MKLLQLQINTRTITFIDQKPLHSMDHTATTWKLPLKELINANVHGTEIHSFIDVNLPDIWEPLLVDGPPLQATCICLPHKPRLPSNLQEVSRLWIFMQHYSIKEPWKKYFHNWINDREPYIQSKQWRNWWKMMPLCLIRKENLLTTYAGDHFSIIVGSQWSKKSFTPSKGWERKGHLRDFRKVDKHTIWWYWPTQEIRRNITAHQIKAPYCLVEQFPNTNLIENPTVPLWCLVLTK